MGMPAATPIGGMDVIVMRVRLGSDVYRSLVVRMATATIPMCMRMGMIVRVSMIVVMLMRLCM